VLSERRKSEIHEELSVLAKQSAWPKMIGYLRRGYAPRSFIPGIVDKVKLEQLSQFTNVPRHLDKAASQLCLFVGKTIPKTVGVTIA
jgi:hypothetical protein